MNLLDFLEKYWIFLSSGVIFPAFWYALGKTFVTKIEFDGERKRITTLEGKVDALPSSNEFHQLNNAMSGLSADMNWLKKNVDLLVQKELNKEKKG
ncbi:DUF2730 family protein [Ignatzschineria cameli]|uniref:DUF2730 family protein n=1 Tax=Ignatzschineria cameli TaxID=2182793 RepID=UPI001300245F|nr:DUF2730 family protein [Ignatzschineria cameli]